jgi:hypothetical protein
LSDNWFFPPDYQGWGWWFNEPWNDKISSIKFLTDSTDSVDPHVARLYEHTNLEGNAWSINPGEYPSLENLQESYPDALTNANDVISSFEFW